MHKPNVQENDWWHVWPSEPTILRVENRSRTKPQPQPSYKKSFSEVSRVWSGIPEPVAEQWARFVNDNLLSWSTILISFGIFWYKLIATKLQAWKQWLQKTPAAHQPPPKKQLKPKMLGHVSILHRRQAPHTKASLRKGVGNMEPKTWPPYLSILTRIPPVHSTWVLKSNRYKMAFHTFQQPIPEPPFTNSWKVTLSSFDAGPPAPSQSSTASSVEAIEFRKTNWTCKRQPFFFMNTIDYFDLFWKILVQAHCYKVATLETMATKKDHRSSTPPKKKPTPTKDARSCFGSSPSPGASYQS